MKLAHWSLFVSGLFFGGVIDHVILGVMKSSITPYGVNLGQYGNWWMALFDLLLTVVFFAPFYKVIVSKRRRSN